MHQFLGISNKFLQYRNKFSKASAVGFLSAILFTVFADPVNDWVDFGKKWMDLTGLPYQMNTALLGFIVGFGTVTTLVQLRGLILKMLLGYTGWMHNPKSTTTKMWALMLNAIRGSGNYPMKFFQPMLPKLPVPNLNTTLDKFLGNVRLIVSDEEYMHLLTAVESFREKEGPHLQQYLQQRSQAKLNWLTDYWYNLAYLTNREPIAVNVNIEAIDCPNPPTTNQYARAANMIHRVLKFHEMLLTETLPPQYLQDLLPLCMEGNKNLLCTCRVPGVGIDELKTWKSKHIIICRRGVYYRVDGYIQDSYGKQTILSLAEIHSIVNQIAQMSDKKEDEEESTRVAVLTSQNRDTWAKQRIEIMKSEVNCSALEDIESAITLFYLDDETPKNYEELASWIMTGNGTNRWFDKSISVPIFANGKVGINCEHSAADGTIPARMWEFVLTAEEYTAEGGIKKDPEFGKRKLPEIQKLRWELQKFENEMDMALEHFKKLAGRFHIRIVSPDYGKSFIKKKRMSPDGYIQMAIQLAYYRLHEKVPKTYETASTRIFAEGRTETIRPVSEYSIQWTKSMDNSRATREQRSMLLKKGIQHQTQVKNDACCGMGFDRHMLGLYAASKDLKIPPPALFTNPNLFVPDILSTSQTPTKFDSKGWRVEACCVGGGFHPLHPEGYGVSYMLIGEEIIKFHVTSNSDCQTTSTAKMADAIVDAMADMKSLLE